MASTSEAAWNDLYNGVAELLGPERAETLMTHLLRDDLAVLTTDVAVLKADVSVLKTDVAELKADVKAINRNLITGLIVIVATMVGVVFAAV